MRGGMDKSCSGRGRKSLLDVFHGIFRSSRGAVWFLGGKN